MIQRAPDHHSSLLKQKKGAILQLVIVVVAVVVLIPQLSQFKNSWTYIQNSHPIWIILGLLAVLSTTVFAALVYLALVPAKLPFKRTVLVQMSTYFTNRLLPSGLGGLGFNALYLSKQTGMSKTESAVYATANNIVGFFAFWVCALLSALLADTKIKIPGVSAKAIVIVLMIGVLAVLLTFLFAGLKKNLLNFLGHLWGVLITITKSPRRLALALLASMGITVSYVIVLWCASQATGASISITDLFIAFMAGNAALSVSPTPGGLGAVEAAMTAILVSASFTPAHALATVILYRILSYWLPIVPGYLAFRTATTRHYV